MSKYYIDRIVNYASYAKSEKGKFIQDLCKSLEGLLIEDALAVDRIQKVLTVAVETANKKFPRMKPWKVCRAGGQITIEPEGKTSFESQWITAIYIQHVKKTVSGDNLVNMIMDCIIRTFDPDKEGGEE